MADITLEKNLPHNLDAERSILGSIILENNALNLAQEILKETDFYREGHRKIFRIMESLVEGSSVIDLVTLKNELQRSGDLDAVGGAAYISSLVDGVPKSANIEYYARIVREKSILRHLIETGNRMITRSRKERAGEEHVGTCNIPTLEKCSRFGGDQQCATRDHYRRIALFQEIPESSGRFVANNFDKLIVALDGEQRRAG